MTAPWLREAPTRVGHLGLGEQLEQGFYASREIGKRRCWGKLRGDQKRHPGSNSVGRSLLSL